MKRLSIRWKTSLKTILCLGVTTFSLACSAAGQTKPVTHQAGAAKSSRSSPSGTKVLFPAPAEYGCTLSIGGAKTAEIAADEIFVTRVEPGEHLAQCINTTKTVVPLKWQNTLKIQGGDQRVISIPKAFALISVSEAASYMLSGRLTLKTAQKTIDGMCDNGEFSFAKECLGRAYESTDIPASTVVTLANDKPKQVGGFSSFLISFGGVRLWYPIMYFRAWDGSFELTISGD